VRRVVEADQKVDQSSRGYPCLANEQKKKNEDDKQTRESLGGNANLNTNAEGGKKREKD